MTPQMHAILGSAVVLVSLLVGVWAVLAARGGVKPSGALQVGVGVALALLVLQVLAGVDLLASGHQPPARGVLGVVHVGGPFLALIGAGTHVFFLRRRSRLRNYATAMLLTFGLGLLSYLIGEMGRRAAGS